MVVNVMFCMRLLGAKLKKRVSKGESLKRRGLWKVVLGKRVMETKIE
jgi:hypothetical protein